MDTIEANKKFEVVTEGEAGGGSSADGNGDGNNRKNLNLLSIIFSILLTGAAIWGVVHGIKQDLPLPASAIASRSGVSYTTALTASSSWLFENLTDSLDKPNQSKTEVFEDDKPLGPAHTNHQDIDRVGSGRYSHWGTTLYFSTSDNSDPRINGRVYKAVITSTSPVWVLAVLVPCLLIPLYLNRRMVSGHLMRLAVDMREKIKADLAASAESPLVKTNPPVVSSAKALNTKTQSAPVAASSRKIRWRWGVLAALAMSLLSLYPQIDLWITRGAEWQGAYASMFYDEDIYAAYINGLLLGRPRHAQPLQVDPAKPPYESQFSIHAVPAYLLVLLARVMGASVSLTFIVLTPLVAFLATLMIFYLLMLVTGDEILAAVGALAILILGTPASRDSVLFEWLFGRRVASGFFLFLRRYHPAIIFPAFFGYISLTWQAFTAEGRKAWYAAMGAGVIFAALIFSHFYLWTSALAWLACLVFVWLMARRAEWSMIIKRLALIALFAAPALAVYAVMLTHRDPVANEVLLLALTHAPDFYRAPEWIGALVILLLIWGVRKERLDWHQPVVLLTSSLGLVPFVVFNQQIITGRSLQPHHYEMFSTNYLSLLALILVLFLLWRGRHYSFTLRVPRFALALLAVIALSWGVAEANYMISGQRSRNVERDRFFPVAKRLTVLAAEHGRTPPDREIVFSPDIYVISDSLATFTPHAPFWSGTMVWAGGLSLEEQQERFFQHLYYCGVKAAVLEGMLTKNDITAVIALFGANRYWPELTAAFKPLTPDEIRGKARQYSDFMVSFNQERARQPQLSYIVVYRQTPFDFSNIDRWYSRDAGEQIGPFTLYQVKLSKLPKFVPNEAQLRN